MAKLRDRDVIVIIPSTGKAGEVDKAKYVCAICGFALNDLRERPRCRLQVEETAKGLRRRQQRKHLLRQIDQIVNAEWGEED